MSQFIETLLDNAVGRRLIQSVLPKATELVRYQPDQMSFFQGALLFGGNSPLMSSLLRNLMASQADLYYPTERPYSDAIRQLNEGYAKPATALFCHLDMPERFNGLVFDASHFESIEDLNELYQFFHPMMSKLQKNGRILVLGRPPSEAKNAAQASAMRALEGFTRSLAKEIGKKGSTCQTLYVAQGAEENLDASLRFFLSPKSAYISGQILTVHPATTVEYPDWTKPLAGKVALVTGAARGIGEAIARTLARDGAVVLGLDIPQAQEALTALMRDIQGTPLLADIASNEAPALIVDALKKLGGADIIVHNAGITRDKTLGKMPEHWWQQTLDINLAAQARINDALLAHQVMHSGGSIIAVSSMNGIAGQAGQSNYAASKAGGIGYVQAMADQLKPHGISINAVAPGFIETHMTDAIPLITREIGRRLNSLAQGGKPVDVAEAIALFANPAANGLSGNVLRVCGQSLVGA